MLATSPTSSTLSTSRLQIGVALVEDADPLEATVLATDAARAGLGEAEPELALVVTAGVPGGDVVRVVRGRLGPVALAGGATSALLGDSGPVGSGALVLLIANADAAVGGAAAAPGPDLAEASGRAARLVLAGWPFRSRYPRGLGLAFASPGLGRPGEAFLSAWRLFMGPKLRTACSVLASPVLYGGGEAVVSVACLEAPYATGFGHTEGFAAAAVAPEPGVLIQGAIDAMLTALKGLQELSPRLVIVIESRARHRALGPAAVAEWGALRTELGERAACVGWVADEVAAYGRGVRPIDSAGALVVVALGDIPRD